jgi:pimeloyl-ACP methyl ester carboxylesterase
MRLKQISPVGLGLGLSLGYILFQQAWLLQHASKDPADSLRRHKNRGAPGKYIINRRWTDRFSWEHTLEDGIERIAYYPAQRRSTTPILMQHGMWHSAWCWQPWQEIFAEWGWESLAYSLPGHAGSPLQRHIKCCTLDYYLGFLRDEVERLGGKPIMMGHSMGTGLGMWYLKYCGDDLPAMVWVAGWDSHSLFKKMVFRFIRHDPRLVGLVMKEWCAAPIVRTPRLAHDILLSSTAIIPPYEFFTRLSSESILPVYQHNPPFWKPPESVRTPVLWVAARRDFTISTKDAKKSALFFGADYIEVDGGHDLFYEPDRRITAGIIRNWLTGVVGV